jgi:integrase
VRPLARGFRVIQQVTKEDGTRGIKTVPVTAYGTFGFRPDMTLEEAKARAKQINEQKSLTANRVINAAKRVEVLKAENHAYLMSSDVARFEDELREMYSDNPYRHEITLRYWQAAQLIILTLAIDPKDFRALNIKLINYFKQKKWSHDYIKRITRILNLWGISVSRYRGSHYDPIPNLSSIQVQSINDKREGIVGVRSPAEPLSWNEIKNKQATFETEGLIPHWNWLAIAAVFGLRGLEVDNLKKGKQYGYLEYSKDHDCEVLWIYQTKLKAIAKDKRWKPIPVVLPEQKRAVSLIHSGEFKRPLNKTLQRIFGDGMQAHSSPRKAFTDYMLEQGFSLEDISIFLGHQSIAITWRVYKNRKRFKLPKVG